MRSSSEITSERDSTTSPVSLPLSTRENLADLWFCARGCQHFLVQDRAQSQEPGAQLRLKDRVRSCPLPLSFLLTVYVGKEGNTQMGLCRVG